MPKNKSWMVLAAAVIIIFLSEIALKGQAIAQGSWTEEAPMPTARSSLAAASVNGLLYAIGGSSDTGVVATVEVYNPTTNSWSTAAPDPTARRSIGAGVVNGLIYVVGGVDPNGNVLNLLEAFDPVANTWTSLSPMPTAREHLGVGVINGVLYAVGGCPAGSGCSYTTAEVDAYDPSTDTWTTTTSLPASLCCMGVSSLNGLLYAAGGGNGSSNLNSLYAFDPTTDTWSTESPMPVSPTTPAAGALDSMFLAAGGAEGGVGIPPTYLATLYSFNP
jgi:N-acetylneuraminic acid mutarotase